MRHERGTKYKSDIAVRWCQLVYCMRHLSSRKVVYSFSPKNKPAYLVADNERVIVETKDAFSGMVRSERTLFENLDMGKINPATGPIAVEGLRKGGVLCVSIERIKCGGRGVTLCSPDLGQLGYQVRKSRTRLLEVRAGKARFSGDVWVDLNPHVGVVGVAPAHNSFPTFWPGDHGGNMDTVDLGPGAKVYLPTFVDGGMLAIGDVHAAMGDGEVCGTGVEVPAEVTVRLSIRDDMRLERPLIETRTEWITYAAAKTLDEAAKTATRDLVSLVANMSGIDFEEAYMLASIAANLKISQVVDPLMAARMSIAKKYL